MVTDSSPPPSDTDPIANGGAHLSPQSRRRSLPSPWASVVRGDPEPNAPPAAATSPESSSAAAASASTSSPPMEEALSSDNSESQPENGDSIARRPVWNRPLNGVVEPVTVMGGAVSWPALSETTRSVPRSSSSDASRIVSDGSVPSSQAPIISQPPQRSPHNNANNVHGNSGGNNPNPARLRRNRGGGGGGGGGGRGSFSVSGPSQGPFNPLPLPMPPPFPVIEVPFGAIPTVLDNSVRGPRPIGGGVGPSHSGNDHPTQRINTRRSNNYGPRPRGDGQYHNNHGGRRDHDRREVRHPPPPPYAPPPMGYMPPPLPPGAASFMAPPPMMLFPGQMGFNMEPPFVYVPPMPPETFRTMPMVPPPPPVIFPPANENPLPNPNLSPNPLPNMIVNQIDYYFSDANLVKDPFLKSQMDDNGWVPISLVASFPRVLRLTNDIPLIVESLRHHSTAVEIQGDMIRRRNDWSLWIGSNGDPSTSGNISAPENALATSLNEVSLDDATAHVNGNLDDAREGRLEMADGQLPEDSTIQSGLANGDHADDHSNSL
ncbi:la-related protein 1C-like isoform X2 [Salvia hispanica]|uniref:la-related protein 1C-like isoform X2 n=1 Tax=Salvia hispanica TaxID=49212 RepID=UPI00200963AB|nr:la-related protein 1C-like isoform X2 [Salvia hispanica]